MVESRFSRPALIDGLVMRKRKFSLCPDSVYIKLSKNA